MYRHTVFVPLLVACALVLAGCDSAGSTSKEPGDPSDGSPEVQSVEVNPDAVTVRTLGGNKQFEAVARDADGNEMQDVSFSWSGVPDSVATVDGAGTATAEGNGSATIEASASGRTGSAQMLVRAGDLKWTEIKAAPISNCGVTTHGTAACWGDNVHGQLGDGNTTGSQLEPVKVQAPRLYFHDVTVGGGHTCMIAQDHTAYCWGASGLGEGGYGEENVSEQTSPVEVLGGFSFVQLVAGGNHTCGLTTDGDAYCWGHNNFGQLGDGSTTDASSPVQVTGGLTFAQLSATAGNGTLAQTCGVTTDGTVYCWGNNRFGQLGDGTTSNQSEPIAVDAEADFTQVAAGQGHTCAVTTQGAAYCWGLNNKGALGDGTTENRRSPVEVEGEHSFRTIAAGKGHTCGLTPDGTALCWGRNASGQLGDGTTEQRTRPVPVAGGHVFTQLDAGGETTVGVDDAGTGYYWGQKGTHTDRPRATEPTALPDPGGIN